MTTETVTQPEQRPVIWSTDCAKGGAVVAGGVVGWCKHWGGGG